MGNIYKCNIVEKLTFDKRKNKLCRNIYVSYKNSPMHHIFKQYSGEKTKYIRYIYFSHCSGWSFYPIGHKVKSYYYGYNIQEKENFFTTEMNCSIEGNSSQTKEQLIELFTNTHYQDFKYTLRAFLENQEDVRLNQVFDLFNQYTKDKKIEFLVKKDLNELAFNSAFLRLTQNKQKQITKLAEKNPKATYHDLLIMAKYNCLLELVPFKGDQKLCDLLKEQDEQLWYYKDYIKLVKECNHNVNEDYWKYPKNLRERHLQLNQEWANICQVRRELERIERQEKEKTRMATISSKIKSVSKKLSVLNQELNGYSICVATDLEDIKAQAETLSQCLISCNYYEKHANKDCILVFIKKGDERLATAQVFYKKENALGQFYGDEKDRHNCLPNQEIKDVFNQWLKNTFIPSKFARA